MAIAVGGVVLVASDPRLPEHPLAVTLALGSIATWAVRQVRIRRLGDVGGMRTLAWLALFSAPQLLVASLLLENGQMEAMGSAGLSDWLSVLYLGVVMTAVGIGVWYHLIGCYPVATVSPFLLLVPVISIAGGVLFLGERLDGPQAIGGMLIMIGVATVVV